MSNKAKKAKVDDDAWGDDDTTTATTNDAGDDDDWGDEPAPDEKKKATKSSATPAKKKPAAAAASGGDDEVDGWGDDDTAGGGGWDDNDDDDDGGVDDTAASSSSSAPKMVGVKLHLAMSKQVLLAIRQKKTTTSSAHRDAASDVLQELYRDYEADLADRVAERKVREAKAKKAGTAAAATPAKAPVKTAAKKASTEPRTSCNICFNPFGDTGDSSAAIMSNCGHFTGCVGCFREWISTKIREKAVTPWLNCAEEDCTAAIHPDDIVSSGISTLLILQFGEVYTSKHLARNENFISCSLEGCGFGFLVEGKKPPKVEMTCQVCTKRQMVEKKEILDPEFKKWIEEGKMKPCPACAFLIMKEYGICNVINCGKCGIWWNWATKETGRDSRELKERARANGTLWQPGELAFQQNLERTDPKAFKELLERNGMKYDPNYRRGT